MRVPVLILWLGLTRISVDRRGDAILSCVGRTVAASLSPGAHRSQTPISWSMPGGKVRLYWKQKGPTRALQTCSSDAEWSGSSLSPECNLSKETADECTGSFGSEGAFLLVVQGLDADLAGSRPGEIWLRTVRMKERMS